MKKVFLRLIAPVDHLHLTSWLFLRLLGLIYLIAFLSLSVQISGLVGPEGILPLEHHLSFAAAQLGQPKAWLRFPSLFWWTGASDIVLQGTALLGAFLSLSLIFARHERVVLIALFLLYLSLYHAGQVFTNFQWDTLLLETGFLAIFLVGGPTRLLIFLFEWLLFRLRFMSGLFKLVSEDPSWTGFTALNHYFETQPLPHIGAWYAHHLPEWVLKTGVGMTFFSELIVPFFIFLPRPFRLAAAAITILMQLLIIATSNHNFINLLTICLCLFLLDDRLIKRLIPQSIRLKTDRQVIRTGKLKAVLISLVTLLIVPASLIGLYSNLARGSIAVPLQSFYDSARSFGIGNIYHIFPTMQRERHELIIQGSDDGTTWRTYEFKYKPGDPAQQPQIVMPHQPRLDWMIWFVPTQQPVMMHWFGLFMQRLHQGSTPVTQLLATNPFESKPPRYLRVLTYRYHFTPPEIDAESGNWWQREYLGEFPQHPPRIP
ncbi:MAG: lipase maturation factor family protein [Candidatus Thiodiazotropha sp. (ex Myrtea sp. 'scaly one' KF741663)]|nr:lipase maturation factor family protein [Candidatus Thiodiazotropha sp. (ex Myrtea sp. 'scaly one' KF741663)]